METMSVITLHLAVMIGLVCLATGLGGLTGPNRWPDMIDEFERSPGLMLAVAFVGVVFGLIIILAHPYWGDPLAVAVSLIGWASFVEGLALLAIPHAYLGMIRPALRFARAWSIFAIVLGLILVVAGLTGRASPLS
ncbi:DUF2065 domain-containing protein [Sphingomonas colocasiae]|uniref:DUF2065 domain-containing protein n=1 Tax=Sphingomonas colocasiae TaxID=1848973 RepID=A0ABS7PWQ2_9SPHN|nr:DUF2065 domain-containing protein [Sphingomonas colocasiae]MBY8824777.1 DUF2065 domain-containing protein [Sphingomonas colocasiae]